MDRLIIDVSDLGILELNNYLIENPIFLGLEYHPNGKVYGIIAEKQKHKILIKK